MPAGRTNLYERYELGEVLGRGGMGVVYRAYDRLMQREVALKTLLDIDNPLTLDLFYKECGLLAAMVHPNIVNVYDVGEFEDNGVKKPFFVMPLLPGATLDHIIRDPNSGLTVERVIEIVAQAARGLQAAHEMGLVHRDVKPSNIFVMDDDSVKIIDFGIARAASMASMTVLKGTLSYMAPEQLNHKPPTPLSDEYSLAVVCYEALAARKPFQGGTESDLADAIMRGTPPPVSELNPNVRYEVSQVIRKAMARQPGQRFPSMRDFTGALNRAARGEPVEDLDAEKITPRLDRATAAFEQGDIEFASELLSELEGDGYLNENITLLRRRLEQAAVRTRVRQLLDNANRYLQAEEYPLALRKIQDALQLDPENADALLFRDRVEKQRRDRKFGECLQQARGYAAAQSFHQAREALTNALKVRPNDTEALRLMAEVGHREQGLVQSREEKAALYESAVQAWERGDMNSALTRMTTLVEMERNDPDEGTGRGAAYQNFYQQVRTEYDAQQNSYEEARRRLETRDFDGALALCRQALTRYPNHAMFQALQLDAESAKARATEEPAQQTAARVSQDRQGLIQTVLDKARFFEERQRYPEAHDQLQIIKAIEPGYAGIDAEIERITDLRDGQARDALRERYRGFLSTSIQTGDFDRAQQALEEAYREFPGDPEFTAMEDRLRDSRERTEKALATLEQARVQAEQGGPEGGFVLLRQAYELGRENPVVRTVATAMFLDYARSLMQQNPDAAERVLREALTIEPDQADVQAMLREITAGRRQEFVAWCIAQARRLRAEGDMPGALVVARQGLATYPDDPTLQQLEAVLSGRPVPAPAPPPPPPAAPPLAPVAAPEPAAEPLDAATIFSTTPAPALPAQMPPPPPLPPSMAATKVDPGPGLPPPPGPPAPRPKPRWMLAAAGAFGVIALLAAGVGFVRMRKPQPPPPPPVGAVKITVQASQPRATILIDGRECGSGSCDVSLTPGEHRAEARLDGYATAANPFTVPAGAAGAAPAVQLTLAPLLPAAVITTNLAQATVTLDQGAQQQVQNGELQLPDLAAGERSIRFNGEGAQAVVAVTVAPASAPALTGPIRQQNLEATAVSAMGATARVLSTLAKAEVTVDGKSAGKTDPAGVDVNGLAPGAHELVVATQSASHRLTFSSGPAPAIAVFFGVERNQGVLRVSTGESDVAVFVNGVKFRRPTQNGRLTLYLEPKVYKIRVEKEGYQPAAEQSVEVKRGTEARADFVLVPLPQTGTVLVSHAPAGADVTMDGTPAGKVHPDGTLGIHDVKPGPRSIHIKKDAFKPVTREVTVVAGRQADVDGALQVTAGSIKITLLPADVPATLTWKREGETAIQPVTENPMPLPEGSYTIIGHAPDYEEARVTARVTAGQVVNAPLVFRKVVVERREPVKPRTVGLEELEKAGWTKENGSLTHIGGNIMVLPSTGGAGSYSFQALMMKGRRLEWVANYVDAKNYVGWELNEDRLERYEFVDGRKTNTAKPKIRVKLDQWIQVTMDVTATAIVVSVKQDAGNVSDRIAHEGPSLSPGQSFLHGRFGFRVPGKDKLVVGTFAFTPK
jgi:serine/threonine-protein kinase